MTSRGGERRTPDAPILALATSAVLALVAAVVVRRYSRYEVGGRSMEPTLSPGDFVIVDRQAYAHRLPRRGHVVVALDPRDPRRTLVKRVERTDIHGDVWLTGDNAEESTASETFGAVPRDAILGRVRWRYWPLSSLVRVR